MKENQERKMFTQEQYESESRLVQSLEEAMQTLDLALDKLLGSSELSGESTLATERQYSCSKIFLARLIFHTLKRFNCLVGIKEYQVYMDHIFDAFKSSKVGDDMEAVLFPAHIADLLELKSVCVNKEDYQKLKDYAAELMKNSKSTCNESEDDDNG